MRNVFTSTVLLLACLAVSVLLHSWLARACKAVMASWRPLASHEHESFGYERRVYHTADPAMQKVVGLALASGLLGWLALAFGHGLVWLLALACMAGAVALDLLSWERVTTSASWLWFQHGVKGAVQQVAIDDIRDLAVDEEEVDSWTLRNLVPGQRNTVCRLRLRLDDKRVVALPQTDSANGLADVEAVANHVRLRKQQAADQNALADSAAAAEVAVRDALLSQSGLDKEMAAELKRLRSKALAPDLPPAVTRRPGA